MPGEARTWRNCCPSASGISEGEGWNTVSKCLASKFVFLHIPFRPFSSDKLQRGMTGCGCLRPLVALNKE
jgi:hypothetical protein